MTRSPTSAPTVHEGTSVAYVHGLAPALAVDHQRCVGHPEDPAAGSHVDLADHAAVTSRQLDVTINHGRITGQERQNVRYAVFVLDRKARITHMASL